MTGTTGDNGANVQAAPDLVKIVGAMQDLYKEWSDKHKRANILIAGKTGVGKSTLINTVFRDNLAETGMGRPVTQQITEITKPGMPLTILDSKGLELADHAVIRAELLEEVASRRGEDADRYVHLAWICIAEDGARIEEAELDLARALKELGVAVIVVITKVSGFSDNAFEQVVRKEFAGVTADIVLTRALEEDLVTDEGDVIGVKKVRGIDQLLTVSQQYIPESQRQSFARALSLKHKKALELKSSEATTAIAVAAGAAGLAGATPLPFADAMALVPVQVVLIIKISQIYGMSVTRDAALPIVTSLVGSVGATMAGRAIVGAILKFVPGVGTIAGGAISGTTAALLTTQMGRLYAGVLADMADRGEPLELGTALNNLKAKLSLN